MKIYFLSEVKAALKLDGEYAGIIDGFERFCEVDIARGALAEIIPDGNLQPLNFFIDEKFFRSPPPFADICLAKTFRGIYARTFLCKDPSLRVIQQRRFGSVMVTIYRQGGLFLSCDGQLVCAYPLPDCYADAFMQEVAVCGKKLLAVTAGKWLTLVNSDGRLLFMNEVESHSFGDMLEVIAPLHTCTDSVAECGFTLADGKFTAVHSRTAERFTPDGLTPFVFFERVLTCGRYADMLCAELKPKAKSLKKYLGDFVAVTVPDEDFYAECGEENAAGLVYRKGKNLYEILYFAVDIEGGFITNVRPV